MENREHERVHKSAVYTRSVALSMNEVAQADIVKKAQKFEEAEAAFREITGYRDAAVQADECAAAAKLLYDRLTVLVNIKKGSGGIKYRGSNPVLRLLAGIFLRKKLYTTIIGSVVILITLYLLFNGMIGFFTGQDTRQARIEILKIDTCMNYVDDLIDRDAAINILTRDADMTEEAAAAAVDGARALFTNKDFYEPIDVGMLETLLRNAINIDVGIGTEALEVLARHIEYRESQGDDVTTLKRVYSASLAQLEFNLKWTERD